MDDDSRMGGVVKMALGAVGLGGAVAVVVMSPNKFGIVVAVIIVGLALLLFGGYYLWQRRRARQQREQFTSAIEAQTAAAPRAISDPKKRADLDKVREKFQKGLHEFKSRGKDIYKLPWYVIIGESGSGKTEAIRHSGIDFPKGLQDEHQGSGGTVNMDWWFTNRGIILDTAGSMIFNEARAGETPEWSEFLRLLKRSRPHSPINGLFLVLSVESLIRDSAEKIAQKASVLTQQLDLIQRTLDVRFPVYLLVTKCDLLTGFREFFDNIEDPLLQHQIFGWSNPDPLDSAFRPDQVEQYLKGMAERIRRRRLALLRGGAAAGKIGDTEHFFASSYQLGGGPATARRLDEVDSMFALPESLMRLAPRLQRYLETIFVAGEWSAKPVFLRGIYFTSSMREGKALDEAIAAATGLPLDQLPEDRSWEKNKAFFLRDLFHDKVFRESGLVTRAPNTFKMLRQRQRAIFGTTTLALLLLLGIAYYFKVKLDNSVKVQLENWQAAAAICKKGEWSPTIVSQLPGEVRYSYGGTNSVKITKGKELPLIRYNQQLKMNAETPLATGLFTPLAWFNLGKVRDRAEAQRLVFERSVVQPLVNHTRSKLQQDVPSPQAISQHREALSSLIRFEADAKANPNKGGPITKIKTDTTRKSERYLNSFLSYLTGTNSAPDTNLVNLFASTYSKEGWPPDSLRITNGGDRLSNNPAIQKGLDNFREANRANQAEISNEVQMLNGLVNDLEAYTTAESNWLRSASASCPLPPTLQTAKKKLDNQWEAVSAAKSQDSSALTSIAFRYGKLKFAATEASGKALGDILKEVPESDLSTGIFDDIKRQVTKFKQDAEAVVSSDYEARGKRLDADCVSPPSNSVIPSYQLRWSLYTSACELASADVNVNEDMIGKAKQKFDKLTNMTVGFQTNLASYRGPSAQDVGTVCNRVASEAAKQLTNKFLSNYVAFVTTKLHKDMRFPLLLNASPGDPMSVKELNNLKKLLPNLAKDLEIFPPEIVERDPLLQQLKSTNNSYASVLSSLVNDASASNWALFFVPEQGGKAIINQFKFAQVSIGDTKLDESALKRLAGETERVVLGRGTVDAGLKIYFQKFSDKPETRTNVLEYATWGLARLIRDNKARSSEGGAWQFQIQLHDSANKESGYATFEARLVDTNHPSPTVENWLKLSGPKQR